MRDSGQLCTFVVSGQRFGIAATHVREVIRHEAARPVPLAPAGVTGVTNVRGEVLAVIDLAVRLGLPAGDPGSCSCLGPAPTWPGC